MVSQIKQGGIHHALVMGFDCRCDYRCHRRCHYEQRSVNGVAQQHHCRIDWFFAWRSTPWVMGTPACWDGHNSVNYWRVDDGSKDEISNTLTNVYRSLAEKGYNPINQIVGYVLSGDPAYVPRYNDARNQIRKYERDEIVEELVRYYLKGNGIDL